MPSFFRPFVTFFTAKHGLKAAKILALLMVLGGYISLFQGRAQAAELVMFESESCEWCAVWKEEIGPIYPKTDEGKLAPLRMVDIHDPRPADLAHINGIRFTPTFVLMEQGQELGRIRGYPGEDFFWGLLGQLIEKLPNE